MTVSSWRPERPIAEHNGPWLAGMCAMLFLALLSFSSYAVTLPFIQREWRLDNTEAAVVFSAYLFGLATASLVAVPLTDRLASERLVVFGVGVLVVSNLLFPLLAQGYPSAIALRFLAGTGHVAAYFPGIRLVSRRFESKGRGSAVAAFVGAGYLGTTVSYAVTGAFITGADTWRDAYAYTACLGLFAVPIAYFVCRRTAAPKSKAAGVLSLHPLRDRPLRLAILAYALHSAELYLARLWLPLLLGAYFMRGGAGYASRDATAWAATLSGLMFSTGVAGVFVGGALSDRWGRTATAGLLFAASGACSFAIGWLLDAPLFFILAVGFVYGFATAADSPIYATAVTELSSPAHLGSALALQSFVGFLAGAAAPMLAGAVLDHVSGDAAWATAFGLNGCVALLGIAALRALRRHPRARALAQGRR